MVPEGLVLLTSVAFAIGVDPARPQAVPGPGAARHRGAGPGRRRLPRQDRHPHRGRHGRHRAAARSAAPTRRYVRTVLGALGASDPRPNASPPGDHRRLPRQRRSWRCTEALPFSSARKYSGAAFSEARRRDQHLAARRARRPAAGRATRRSPRSTSSTTRACGSCCSPAPRGDLDDPAVAEGAEPAALVVLEQRLRPDAADTLRYFAEQDVRAKVISGDNAVSVGAVAGKLGLPGARGPGRRPPTARRPGRDGRGAGRGHGLRPGHPAAEAGHGRRAPVARAHRRDDRRRRQRRARPQGRRHRRRHGLGLRGDPRRRADRAAQQQLRHAALGRRRGPPGHRQHHPRRDPVPGEDRLLGAAGRAGGLLAGRVPVPAPAPDPAVHPDHRHPGVLPGARAQQGARAGRTSCGG